MTLFRREEGVTGVPRRTPVTGVAGLGAAPLYFAMRAAVDGGTRLFSRM